MPGKKRKLETDSTPPTRSSRRVQEKKEKKDTKDKDENPFELKWSEHETILILDAEKDSKVQITPSRLIAGFDLDWTLIKTSSGRVFAQGRNDWEWLYSDVIVTKLKEYHQKGYKLVIFSNQNGIGKGKITPDSVKGKILDIIKELNLPLQAFLSTQDDRFRKPFPYMWEHMVSAHNGGVVPELKDCVYVGDAAGRPKEWDGDKKTKKDFSNTDRAFAHNIGIPFQTPNEFFLSQDPPKFNWDGLSPTEIKDLEADKAKRCDEIKSDGQELVILVGSPASGKSSFAKEYFVSKGYVWVNRDTLKTKEKCLKAAKEGFAKGKSVVIDNTNPKKASRALYIKEAKKKKINIRCYHLLTSKKICRHLNMFRENITGGEHAHVPRLAFAVYNKDFEQPSLEEGFDEIIEVNFSVQENLLVPHTIKKKGNNIQTDEARRLFFQLF